MIKSALATSGLTTDSSRQSPRTHLEFFVLAAVQQGVLVEIKIVQHRDFVALGQERGGQDRTEVTGAAGDQNFHEVIIF